MANLKLGLLGSLQVMAGSAPIATLESDKARALLAYLAVEAQSPHRREALVGLLWPEFPEEVARRNLRQTLYNLRNAIGDHTANPPYLLISRDEIQFNTASDCSLDVSTFGTLLETCDKHLPRCIEVCVTHAARLEQAIGLYRGPFLHEFFLSDSSEFEEWVVQQREALHRRALEALTYLANYYELDGEYEVAGRWAQRLLELDPWREEAHRQVMRVLTASGHRSAALAQYEACRRVLIKELGVEPSAETRDLYEHIKKGELGGQRGISISSSAWTPLSLPAQATPFVGREKELEELGSLLANPECRLLTLVGPGGIGKTRLALQAAERHSSGFAQGSAFIPLASVGSIEAVIPAMATGIGLGLYGPTDPKTQLLKYLRDKQVLLVVDNVEHLLGAGPQQDTIADLFTEILQAAGQVKLLVTSRQVLNLQGDWTFEVQGLTFPELGQTDGLEEYSAVSLFVQRARRARPGFELNAHDKTGVARLCRLVGGLPLAIELAAAWVRTLTPAEIANEIEASLDFLNAQMRDLPERHRSMRAVFDHSWQILTEEERQVLRRMSVFRGGFTREAAEAVAGAGLVLLSALVAKSLLRRTSDRRYGLHELVRQYAALRLAQAPEEEREARDRHSAYYTDYAARLESELKGAEQPQARAAMEADIDNIRAGWRWAVQLGHTAEALKPIRALQYFYDIHSWFQEAEASFAWAAEKIDTARGPGEGGDSPASTLREYIRANLGWFYIRRGKLEQADVLLQSSLASLRSFGTGIELADVLYYAGAAAWMTGDYPRARTLFLEELAVAEQFGNPWDVGLASIGMGLNTQTIGEYEEAQQHWQRALAIFRRLGDQRMMASALNFSSILKRVLGAHAEAETCLRECLALSESVGDRVTYGMALSQLGLVTQALGHHHEAVELLNECVALLREQDEFWSLLHALIGLGAATLSIGDYTASRAAHYEALRLAWERQALPEVLEAMTGMARWWAQQGAPERALASAFFVLNHWAATEPMKEAVRQVRAELELGLSPEEIEAIQVRLRAESSEKIIQELLTVER